MSKEFFIKFEANPCDEADYGLVGFCYTGVDQILTKYAGGSTLLQISHATGVKMLPTGHTVYADTSF